MKYYQCSLTVQASKIMGIGEHSEGASFYLESDFVDVTPGYLQKFHPVIGGYYLIYADGTEGYATARNFETNYQLCEA